MLKIVYFTADWCAPCQSFKPIVKRASDTYGFDLEFVEIDGLPPEELRGVRSVPTLLFYKDGEEVNRVVGAYPENRFIEVLTGYV